jgi:lysophospholipase L1-like esterase
VRLPAAWLVACALLSVRRWNAYKSNPLHPNADGYRILAQAVAELLRRAGVV